MIASGSGDRTVRLWDIETNQQVLQLLIDDGVTTVAISPDNRYVAAGSLDKSVRVWDTNTGFLFERLEGEQGHMDSVYSVAFAPNGRDLVSGSLDKTIKMWELSAPPRIGVGQAPRGGKCIRTFEGHKVSNFLRFMAPDLRHFADQISQDFVLSVALTPDGRWVLSGSKDRGVQFWDPNTGTAQLMLQGHKNSGKCDISLVANGPILMVVQSSLSHPAQQGNSSQQAAVTCAHEFGGTFDRLHFRHPSDQLLSIPFIRRLNSTFYPFSLSFLSYFAESFAWLVQPDPQYGALEHRRLLAVCAIIMPCPTHSCFTGLRISHR